MKKSGKILFVSILIIMFMLAFSNIVKAADEIEYRGSDDGYEELGTGSDEGTTQKPAEESVQQPAQQPAQEPAQQPTQEPAQKPAEPTTTTNTVEPANNANTSTEAHAKAGDFKTTIYVVLAVLFGVVLGAGYTKIKKYNF